VSGDTFTVNFRLNAKVFAYLGANETVANAFGLLSNWSDKTPSVSLSGGYFNFSAKMVRGQKYRLNFQGDKGTWAEQRTLKLSAYAYSSGTSTDLSLSLNTAANGFVFVMPATKK
ncbi:MAG TPA: hypothetical protein VMD74_01250, partial [Candidatus Methylomirabilis sp.]|nr:hypothetical protein [Candidatus Methylomirabilis sp.]